MEWAGLTNRYSHPSIETTESDTLKEMYGGDGSKFDPMNNPLGSAPASSSRTQHSKLADVSIDSSRTKTPLQRARPRLLTCLRCVLVANTQISVVVVCFTIYYTYCISMNKVFNQHDIWQVRWQGAAPSPAALRALRMTRLLRALPQRTIGMPQQPNRSGN